MRGCLLRRGCRLARGGSAIHGLYLTRTAGRRTLLLELGVGMNTPGIIKYPFWRMTAERADVTFATVNLGMGYVPPEIAPRSMIINGDIAKTLRILVS